MREEMKLNITVYQPSTVKEAAAKLTSKADNPVVDIDKTQVGSRYPNVEKVDNELIACVRAQTMGLLKSFVIQH